MNKNIMNYINNIALIPQRKLWCPKGVILVPSFVLMILISVSGLFAQEASYEKASQPLLAVSLQPMNVRTGPSTENKAFGVLRKNVQLIIVGRQGEWFEVIFGSKSSAKKGWVFGKGVRVVRPYSGKVPSIETERLPKAIQSSQEKETSDVRGQASFESEPIVRTRRSAPVGESIFYGPKMENPFRLTPHFGFSYGAKNFPNQIQGGVGVFYSASKEIEMGLDLALGFRKVQSIFIVPQANTVLPWPYFGKATLSLILGTPFVYLKDSGSKDLRFGFRAGLEYAYPFGSGQRERADLRLFGLSDVLVIGSKQISVPLTGGIAFGYRF